MADIRTQTEQHPGYASSHGPEKVRGLFDRAIAWILCRTDRFSSCWAINIFPLIWTASILSFTNYRVNRPNNEVEWVGVAQLCSRILGDPALVWR